MRNPDFRSADRLHSLAIHLLRRLRRLDAATGVSGPRLSVLSILVIGGPRTLTALADAEQVRPPTMSRLIAAMDSEGLVARRTDLTDGRAIRVSATPKGRRLLVRGRERRVEALADAMASLPADDRRRLEEALDPLQSLVVQVGTPAM